MSEQLEQILLWTGVACYAISLVWLFFSRRLASNKHKPTGLLILLALLCFTFAIAVRWLRLDQGPFFTLYEILLSNLFSLGLVYTIVFYRCPDVRSGATVVLVILLLLGLWCGIESPVSVPLPASYANNWLWAHVGLGKFFLGFCLAATGMAIVRLFGKVPIFNRDQPIPSVSGELLIWKLMASAFFFQSLMLISGAVWANDAWGRYWSWDPLETWAFLTWLCLAILLHVRLTFKSMPQFVGWVGVVCVFTLAFLTFFGIPFLSIAPHKGVM